MTNPLNVLRVLITRPILQAKPLLELLLQHHIKTTLFPLIDIKPLSDAQIDSSLRNILHYHIIICVSVNAAQLGLKSLQRLGISPEKFTWFAVGSSTAEILRSENIVVHVADSGSSSEDLLTLLTTFDLRGKRILIWRGQGGRELLKDNLIMLGAHVDYAQFYQRSLPPYAPGQLDDTLQTNKINVIHISSGQGLEHLCQLNTDFEQLRGRWLVVPSQRVAHMARQRGFMKVINACGMDGPAILQALTQVEIDTS
jgi:uroporphyrinogen-III synthase